MKRTIAIPQRSWNAMERAASIASALGLVAMAIALLLILMSA